MLIAQFYDSAKSKIIISVKPRIAPMVPNLLSELLALPDGINSSTTTYIIAPLAKLRINGRILRTI